jgi:hypothetical protein
MSLLSNIFARKRRREAEIFPAPEKVSDKRRSFLKYMLVGGGAFVAGKVLGPSLDFFSFSGDFSKVTDFKNFRVVETAKELTFYDRFGNEILALDKSL